MQFVFTTILLVAALFLGVTTRLQAGFLATAGAKWQMSSFRPLVEEPTPNYYGYGVSAATGYSFGQLLDLAVFATYVPSQLKTASLAREKLQTIQYGAEVGFRFADAVYIGFRGLSTGYRLLFQSNDSEVDGLWRGSGGGVVIGAFFRENREHFYQFGVDISSSTLRRTDAAAESRVMDTFALNLSYSFNAFNGFRLTSLFNSGFLRSLNL